MTRMVEKVADPGLNSVTLFADYIVVIKIISESCEYI